MKSLREAPTSESRSQRLELALETSGLGVWDWDLRQDFVALDARWCEMLGLDAASTPMTLDTWKHRVHPDDLPASLRDLQEHLEGRTSAYANIHRLQHADGRWIRVLARGRVSQRDELGRPLRVTGTHTDITETELARDELRQAVAALREEVGERKRAEAVMGARLRLSEFARGHSLEEVLTKTLDEAEALTGSVIGFFHFVDANQEDLSLQTWSTNTLRHMCKAEGKGAHYAVQHAGVWADALRTRQPVVHNDYARLEHRRGLPAGHAPVQRELVVPILRNGLVVGLLGVGNAPRPYHAKDVEYVSQLVNLAWDIVLAKRNEEDARRREALLAHTQAFAHVGGWEYDGLSKAVTWTEEVRHICEVGPEYPASLFGAPFLAGRDREAFQEGFERVCAGGEPFDLELQLTGARGAQKWVRIAARAELQGGRATGVLGHIMDITQRRQLQVRLALDDRLATMGLLAAGFGHELNNPLAYVLSNLDTLAQELPRVLAAARRSASGLRRELGATEAERELGDPDALSPLLLDDLLDCARSALEGTRRIQAVSRRLASMARVERKEPAPVDVNGALEAALGLLQNEVRFRATLVKALGRVPPVAAAEGKLSQLFVSLLTNAANAITEGHAAHNTIAVRTWAEDDDVFIEIADTGCGIARDELERVFEPFHAAQKNGASGLGLAISRSIVTGYGGHISLASEVGKGTQVLVRLPAAREAAALLPARAPAADASPRRVVVIDDEASIRRALSRLLGRDYGVTALASGREALALFAQDASFDAVLCDVMMPDMTGMQVHAWLVEHAPALAARVIFITGGAFTPNAEAYLAKVDNPRVDKPYDADALRQVVAGVARVPEGAVTSRGSAASPSPLRPA